MTPGKNIMIIDDEPDLCLLMKNYFVRRHFNVSYALTLSEGMEMLDQMRPDIVFLDNNLPDGIGWYRLKDMLETNPGIRVYLMSGYQPILPKDVAPDRYTVIQKPISFTDLDFLV